jgi:hypothetical protein
MVTNVKDVVALTATHRPAKCRAIIPGETGVIGRTVPVT